MKLICPDCGKQYESGKFCLECGAKLQEVAPELVCPSCGFKAKTGKFCPECGAKLTEQAVLSKAEANNTQEERKFNEKDERFTKYYDKKGFPRTIPQDELAIAIEELTPFAEQGIAEAQMLLGYIYIGDASSDMKYKGIELLKTAEHSGNKEAYYMMGMFYYWGVEQIVPENHNEAEKRLNEYYAEYQSGDAASGLAELYAISEEKCDYKKAFEYATIAAEDDEKDGYFILGFLYLNGKGVERNIKLALENYKMAAALGDERAINQIGFIYMGNDEVGADAEQSFYWYNEAAQKGYDVGLYNVGCCYQNGFGVEKDEEKAAEYFKQAADLGNVDAMFDLGGYYQNVLINPNKAKMWYQKAAELGHPESLNCLGVIYSDIEQNFEEAIKCYEKAIELEQPNAYRNLAICYRDGIGVDQDLRKAEKLLDKAIELGIEDAAEIKAEMSARNATSNTPDSSLCSNDETDQSLRLVNQGNDYLNHNDVKRAKECFMKAAEMQSIDAMINLAILSEDDSDIFYWLDKAKSLGTDLKKFDYQEIYDELFLEFGEKETHEQGKINIPRIDSANEWYVPEGTQILNTDTFPDSSNKWKKSIKVIHLPHSLEAIDFGGYCLCDEFHNLERVYIPNGEIERFCEIDPWIDSTWDKVWNEDGTHAFPELLPIIDTFKGEFCSVTPYTETIVGDTFDYGHIIITPMCRQLKNRAFKNAKSLDSIYMFDGVEVIGKSAFSGCKKLKKVTLSKNIKKLQKETFYDCRELKDIVIPAGVLVIEEAVFYNCKSLETITLPSTVIQIDNGGVWGFNPFFGCDSLKKIIVPKGSMKHFQQLLNGFAGNPARFLVEE